MEERCNFFWQIIEENQVLREKIHDLECFKPDNYNEQVDGFIDLFRDLEEIMECVVESYHSTRILNNNSYLLRMRS